MILGGLIKKYRTEAHMSMEQFAQRGFKSLLLRQKSRKLALIR